MITMSVTNLVDEGLQDGPTYEDQHTILERIKVEMLPDTYMIPRRRRLLRQSRSL
jgi:hypothetical protein